MIFDTLRTELGRQSDEDKGRLHQYHAVGANIAEVSASADFLAVTCELLSCTHYRPAFYPIFLATHSSLAKKLYRTVCIAFPNKRPAHPYSSETLAAALISLAWVLPDHYRFCWPSQTREAAQFILETLDPHSDAVLAPCKTEPNFSCVYDVGHLSPRFSRYVHYLNYNALPEIVIRPDTYADGEEARKRALGYRDAATKTVYLIDSRKHLVNLPDGVRELSQAAFRCIETIVFCQQCTLATVSRLTPPRARRGRLRP